MHSPNIVRASNSDKLSVHPLYSPPCRLLVVVVLSVQQLYAWAALIAAAVSDRNGLNRKDALSAFVQFLLAIVIPLIAIVWSAIHLYQRYTRSLRPKRAVIGGCIGFSFWVAYLVLGLLFTGIGAPLGIAGAILCIPYIILSAAALSTEKKMKAKGIPRVREEAHFDISTGGQGGDNTGPTFTTGGLPPPASNNDGIVR